MARLSVLLCAALAMTAAASETQPCHESDGRARSPSAPLDPMVPINPEMADAKTLASDIRSAYERWGLRRFILTGPHAVNTQFNKTTVDTYRKLGERIAEIRGYLAGTDIELGWWIAPTLRQGFGTLACCSL